MDKLTLSDALRAISDGHTEYSVEYAKKVCDAFSVPFDDGLIDKWESAKDAHEQFGGGPKSLFLNEDTAGEGVYSLSLSYHVARQLGVDNYERKMGRGFQAQSIASAVREFLDETSNNDN